MKKAFLGGTCNESTWRDELIPMLTVQYFNPVVEDWTPECQAEEQHQKDHECNIHLYVITPLMTGVFSIAEIIESSHNARVKTVVYIKETDKDKDGKEVAFTYGQMKSLKAVCSLAERHGAFVCNSLRDVAAMVNNL